MPLTSLFRRHPDAAVLALYAAIVKAARAPLFFTVWQVPDTLDGRFETIAVMAFLVLQRLKAAPEAAGFAQSLHDTMFADFDRNLREMGASDLGVGRQVKTMAKSFYGRIRAYERGLAGAENLDAALRRNLFGTATPAPEHVAAAVAYLRRAAAALESVPVAALMAGELPAAVLAAGDRPPVQSEA
jgi:cytochrome b pre-mRNA-processing protein 3